MVDILSTLSILILAGYGAAAVLIIPEYFVNRVAATIERWNPDEEK
jgi:hypothetical protein